MVFSIFGDFFQISTAPTNPRKSGNVKTEEYWYNSSVYFLSKRLLTGRITNQNMDLCIHHH